MQKFSRWAEQYTDDRDSTLLIVFLLELIVFLLGLELGHPKHAEASEFKGRFTKEEAKLRALRILMM